MTCLIVVGGLGFYSLVGLIVVRHQVLPRLRITVEDSEFSGTIVQSIMVFYGLAMALIAVSVWETHSDVSSTVSHEASRLAALYRDASGYPQPIRSELQQELRGYVDYLIHQAWPMHHRGGHPTGGVEWMNRFQIRLVTFEPATEAQKLLHAETLRAYNHMIEARRMRLDAMLTQLPDLLWGVLLVGALISLSAVFFFKVEDVRLHGILAVLLATFIGMVMLMIVSLDRPFHGELGIGPESYQLVYDQFLKPGRTVSSP